MVSDSENGSRVWERGSLYFAPNPDYRPGRLSARRVSYLLSSRVSAVHRNKRDIQKQNSQE